MKSLTYSYGFHCHLHTLDSPVFSFLSIPLHWAPYPCIQLPTRHLFLNGWQAAHIDYVQNSVPYRNLLPVSSRVWNDYLLSHPNQKPGSCLRFFFPSLFSISSWLQTSVDSTYWYFSNLSLPSYPHSHCLALDLIISGPEFWISVFIGPPVSSLHLLPSAVVVIFNALWMVSQSCIMKSRFLSLALRHSVTGQSLNLLSLL